MAMIPLKIKISGYTGKLLIQWFEESAPLAQVGISDDFDFPYDDTYNIADIRPVVHIVKMWRSDDGVSLDELIDSWQVDAARSEQPQFLKCEYKVDRGSTEGTEGEGDYWIDPENLDTELIDERLAAAEQSELVVHEAGYGDLHEDEYELRDGGGIVLLNGKTFDSDVRWTIKWFKIITVTESPDQSNASEFTSVVVVTADRDAYVDANDNLYNKFVVCNKAGSVLTITFDDLSTIPNDTKIFFGTHQGAQKYVKLQFDTGDNISWFGQSKNVVYIPKCEIVGIYFYDGAVYFIKAPERGLLRGSVVADYDNTRHTDTGAYILADESTGELAKADYPGLYEFIENLPSGSKKTLGTGVGQWGESATINAGKINEAAYYPNKCYWGIDTVAEIFRVPHLKNMGRRFVNTGENPGRYQHDQVGKFEAIPTVPDAFAHTNGPHEPNFTGGAANLTQQAKSNSKFETGNTETTMKNYGETPYIVL
jgi:hypothetical protein